MALILCKNQSGVWGWRDEASTNGHTKIMKSSDNKVVMEAPPSLDINYTGAPIALKLSPGKYKMECWGAAGGWGTGRANPYGKGGYTVGEVSIIQETTVWLYIGRRGSHFDEANFTEASFNGGGYYVAAFNNGHSGGGGGGSSDIRLVGGTWNDSASLISRIMVAGGGGGGQSTCGGSGTTAGHGGGITGTRSYNTNSPVYGGSYSNGGSQTAGGASWNNTGQWHYTGSFGKGANSDSCGAGGGGGYYGGGASYTAGGGGGSSFISGLTGCNAVNASGAHTGQAIHYSGLIFRNASTTGGVKEGDGAIKITLLEPYTFGTYIVKDGDKIGWRHFKSNIDVNFDLSTIGSSIPVALRAGRYKVELWGGAGQGADPLSNLSSRRGRGGYTSGELSLPTSNTLYLFIGGAGGVQSSTSGNSVMVGGYNGGGDTFAHSNGAIGGAGGGATDIRLIDGLWNDATSLRSRIMVAAGAGGADNYGGGTKGDSDDGTGGDGGGLSGVAGMIAGSLNGTRIPPGTQTTGWGFGVGGPGRLVPEMGVIADTGGGGGGYYGGYGSDHNNGGGAGGSSFISGYTGCNAVNANGVHTGQPNHYSGLVFVNGTMTVGGNDGNGKAKITLLEYF